MIKSTQRQRTTAQLTGDANNLSRSWPRAMLTISQHSERETGRERGRKTERETETETDRLRRGLLSQRFPKAHRKWSA